MVLINNYYPTLFTAIWKDNGLKLISRIIYISSSNMKEIREIHYNP